MNDAAATLTDTDARDLDAEHRDELLERMEKTPFCMLVSRDAEGRTHVRPMTTQAVEMPRTAWFFCAADGRLADEVSAHPDVLLSYADTGDNAYAAVRGRAVIVRDVAKARELWSPLAGAWFPGGPEDPNLGLLRVTLEWAEAWEPPAGKVVQFLEIAAAALTKRPPDHEDTYRKIDF